MGEIAFLDLALEDAIHGRFPTVYAFGTNNEQLTAATWNDFVAKAAELLDKVGDLADKARSESKC